MSAQKVTKKKAAAQRRSVVKHRPKRGRKGGSTLWQRLRSWLPGWPTLLGAAIVGVTCWWLAKTLFDKDDVTPPPLAHTYTVRGIDVSHHQGTIDWELLRNQGVIDSLPVSFVFIKATEGGDMVDSHFKRNFTGARMHGIMRGAYHFYRTSAPAKAQAEHFIRHVQLEQGDLPPVLDVEVKPADVSQEEFRQGILEWLVRVEQHYHVKPILYTYHAFRQQYMNDSVFNLYPYWIAHYYVDSVRYRGPWAFWQHSDNGQLPGINGAVDLDVFRGTYDELKQLTLGQR